MGLLHQSNILATVMIKAPSCSSPPAPQVRPCAPRPNASVAPYPKTMAFLKADPTPSPGGGGSSFFPARRLAHPPPGCR